MTTNLTTTVIEGATARLQLGWTQVHLAEDARGEGCDPDSERAVAWCAYGALIAAAEALGLDDDRRTVRAALYRVAFAAGCADDDWERGIEGAVSNWNDDDHRSQEDVISAFKQAIYDGQG
jgi:hypothetical protein